VKAETIYKGATRPAMKLGVPLVPLVVLACAAMLLVLWGGLLVSWWVAAGVVVAVAPVLAWMRLVTARDDQRLRQMFVALKLRANDHNRQLWQSRSYAPSIYRGTRDGWHR
jgi:type IV secretion system protein VirB3